MSSAPAPPASFYGDLSCSAAAMNGDANAGSGGNGNNMMGYNRYHSSAASAAAMRTAYSMAAAQGAAGAMGRGPPELGRANPMFNPSSLNLNGNSFINLILL